MERTAKKKRYPVHRRDQLRQRDAGPDDAAILQCKTFGNQAVPEGWVIVAAGNPPEYNKSVREFDLVTLDRVRIDVEPKLSVWQDYARAHRLHPAVTAYLELRPQHFYKIENDVDGVQFVTARGWEDLSAFLQAADRLGSAHRRGRHRAIPAPPGGRAGFCGLLGALPQITTRTTASRISCRASPLTRWWPAPWTRALTSASAWSACCWRG